MADRDRPTAVSLWDFFGDYPDDHPVAGEKTRMVMVGYPAGRTERFSRKSVSIFLAFAIAVPVSLALLQLPFATALGVGALAAAAVGFVWWAARKAHGVPPDAKVGVLLTSARVVVARSVRGSIPVVLAEVPPERVRSAHIELVPSFWSRTTPATGLTLGGPDGDLVTIEVPRARVELLAERLRDAGITDVTRA
jgi:hypothetical protein